MIPAPMTQKSILIADDSSDIIRLVVSELTKEKDSWRIFRASDGIEAFKVAKLEIPDIILMDWDMPAMNGIEATRKIRKHEDTSEIPVIMATGEMTSSENLQVALEAGAWDYVRKPIDFIELKARIHSALKLREQQEEIKRLLKNEIDLKSRQLSTTSMLIVEKNGVIQKFHEDLEELKESDVQNELINSIQKRIHHHLEADDSWTTFKMHFEDVHPDFFSILKKNSEDISHKDLKLCAYLKLGLDTKEIASLLNVTPASIRTAMYRMKKKMNVAEEDSLRDYLAQIN